MVGSLGPLLLSSGFKSHKKATNALATVYGLLRSTEVVDCQYVRTVTAEYGTNEGPCVDNQTKRLSHFYLCEVSAW